MFHGFDKPLYNSIVICGLHVFTLIPQFEMSGIHTCFVVARVHYNTAIRHLSIMNLI